jgi:hypothetical protein
MIIFRMNYWEYCYKENELLLNVLSYSVLLFSVDILAFVKCEPGQLSWYSDFGMDWKTEESEFISAKTKKFSSTPWCVQNSSGAHPSSSPLGTRGLFDKGKVSRAWSYTYIPQYIIRACS